VARERPTDRRSEAPKVIGREVIGKEVIEQVGPPRPPSLSAAIQRGADSLLVQAALLQQRRPGEEQFLTGAAVHRSLEGLQFVDLSGFCVQFFNVLISVSTLFGQRWNQKRYR